MSPMTDEHPHPHLPRHLLPMSARYACLYSISALLARFLDQIAVARPLWRGSLGRTMTVGPHLQAQHQPQHPYVNRGLPVSIAICVVSVQVRGQDPYSPLSRLQSSPPALKLAPSIALASLSLQSTRPNSASLHGHASGARKEYIFWCLLYNRAYLLFTKTSHVRDLGADS